VLHDCGYAHVNLKCNKILCKRLSDGSMHCRITDLGSALRVGNDACMPVLHVVLQVLQLLQLLQLL